MAMAVASAHDADRNPLYEAFGVLPRFMWAYPIYGRMRNVRTS